MVSSWRCLTLGVSACSGQTLAVDAWGFYVIVLKSLGDDIAFWNTERGRVLLGLMEPEISTNPPRRTPA
jgi:hypothetical protein